MLPPFPYDPTTYDAQLAGYTGGSTGIPAATTSTGSGEVVAATNVPPADGSTTTSPPVYYTMMPVTPGQVPPAVGVVATAVPTASTTEGGGLIDLAATGGIQPILAPVPLDPMFPVPRNPPAPASPPAASGLPSGTTVATPNPTPATYVPGEKTVRRVIEGWILVLGVLIVALMAGLTIYVLTQKADAR